jgi:hypothetical protein
MSDERTEIEKELDGMGRREWREANPFTEQRKESKYEVIARTAGLHEDLVRKLDNKTWSLDEACWIFAGYLNNDPMKLVRFSDRHIVPFGSADYKFAQDEHDRIFKLMQASSHFFAMRMIKRHAIEEEGVVKYRKDWLIDIAVKGIAEYKKFPIPWLEIAYKAGLVGGKVLGKPDIVSSGQTNMTSTTTTEAKAEVVKPTKQFTVKPLKNEMHGIKKWVYDMLVYQSNSGKPREKVSSMLVLMEEHYEHYKRHDKNEIFYYDEDADEEKTWSDEALKKFIQHWTE